MANLSILFRSKFEFIYKLSTSNLVNEYIQTFPIRFAFDSSIKSKVNLFRSHESGNEFNFFKSKLLLKNKKVRQIIILII